MSTANAQAEQKLVAIAEALLKGHELPYKTLSRAQDGREHFVFLFSDAVVEQDWVLKVPRLHGWKDPWWPDRTPIQAFRVEEHAIRAMSGASTTSLAEVRVPTPYRVLTHFDLPAAVMARLPGAPPERSALSGGIDETILQNICHMMGSILGTIHLLKRPSSASPIPDLPFCEPSSARLLHMDFHLGNVLGMTKIKAGWKPTGVIDWTCAKWGPREMDVCEMGASVFAFNPKALDPFLSGYRKASGADLDPKRVRAFIAWEIQRRMGTDPPSDPAQLSAWMNQMNEWWDDGVASELSPPA